MNQVVVSGAFDDLRSPSVRFLEEASRLGPLTVVLWPDRMIEAVTGKPPKFRLNERRYVLEAIRFVAAVTVPRFPFDPEVLPLPQADPPTLWVVSEPASSRAKRDFCSERGVRCRVLPDAALAGFPESVSPKPPDAARVLVTGSFDWLHSGHIRFFEEVSTLGELTVVVGHDANIRLLKGEGHPMFPQAERRYLVQAIRHVSRTVISSGNGWLDAEPEILALSPDIYAVNADGDRPEKRRFCLARGIEYRVLPRTPRHGLPRRSSTELRGF